MMKTALTMITLLVLSSGAMAESNYIQRMAQAQAQAQAEKNAVTPPSAASNPATQSNYTPSWPYSHR